MIANDAVTAAQLMQDNPRDIALGLLAAPGERRKWSDVATRALVTTANPMSDMFEVCKLLKNIEKELLVFGNADPAVMAMHDKVSELTHSAIEVFGDLQGGPPEGRRPGTGYCRGGYARLGASA